MEHAHEHGMGDGPRDGFDTELGQTLRASPFLRTASLHTEIPHINLILINAPWFLKYVNSRCSSAGVASEDMALLGSSFQCGSASFFSTLSSTFHDGAAAEELDIRLSGKVAFTSTTMRPSGWFSGGILRRNYARESVDPADTPAAVVVDADQVDPRSMSHLQRECNRTGVPLYTIDGHADDESKTEWARGIGEALHDTLASRVVSNAIEQAETEGYDKGYREGKRAGRESERRRRSAEVREAQRAAQAAAQQRRQVHPQVRQTPSQGNDASGGLRDAVPAPSAPPLDTAACALFCNTAPTGSECPITYDIMEGDVCMTPAGHSYSCCAIRQHLASTGTDPMTREPCRPDELRRNRALEDMIAYWKERCRQCSQ